MLPARGGASTGLGGLFPEPAERKAKVVWSWWGKKLEEGSEKRRDTKQLQRSAFFIKNIDATIKRLKQHFKRNFLKMSTENYFCSAMIQWPAMLLNNGGTLSSYALKKKKILLKYRESQNIIEQITKTKEMLLTKKPHLISGAIYKLIKSK